MIIIKMLMDCINSFIRQMHNKPKYHQLSGSHCVIDIDHVTPDMLERGIKRLRVFQN